MDGNDKTKIVLFQSVKALKYFCYLLDFYMFNKKIECKNFDDYQFAGHKGKVEVWQESLQRNRAIKVESKSKGWNPVSEDKRSVRRRVRLDSQLLWPVFWHTHRDLST
jgi:hypothetical protein